MMLEIVAPIIARQAPEQQPTEVPQLVPIIFADVELGHSAVLFV